MPVGAIPAAGTGSRLGVGSKALARLAGITLLERAVSTLREVGIEEILVVVGHETERVREFVRERGLGVQLVENGDFVSETAPPPSSARERQDAAFSSRWSTTSSTLRRCGACSAARRPSRLLSIRGPSL